MKRLIVCSDGTWNRPSQANPTNVTQISRLIVPVDGQGVHQVVFYDWGLGTGNLFDRLTGGAFGTGLDRNIEDGYRFLVQNYSEGDEVYLFGFSRGAYTARSLAGLVRNCGLLQKRHAARYDEAYQLYRNRDGGADTQDAIGFRSNYSREIDIKFVGVWDTVGALGVPLRRLRWLRRNRYKFHDTELSRRVKFAYHALAIDEKRGPFEPTLWTNDPKEGQTIEQAWFVGVHSDIGGGNADHGLADITLKWMIDRASACGIEFDSAEVNATVNPDPLGTLHNSKTGLYRFSRGHTRALGVASARSEGIHQSAVTRVQRTTGRYGPSNVTAYIANPEHRVVQ